MSRYLTHFLATAIALALAPPAMAGHRGWARASSAGRDLLVGAALGVPAVQGDWRGDLQAGASLLAAGGTTFVLKELIHERRPDGSDDKSFPSGHTSVSFAAAATLEKRYGWKAGVPALAVASLVGLARVEADKHYVHDVLAGAAIGGISGLLLTGRRDDLVRLTPWSAHGGGGIDVTLRF
jgi:membrane-associated phospholipid phosphatase